VFTLLSWLQKSPRPPFPEALVTVEVIVELAVLAAAVAFGYFIR